MITKNQHELIRIYEKNEGNYFIYLVFSEFIVEDKNRLKIISVNLE